MKVTREVHPIQETYCLTLDLEEAYWLIRMCQNQLRQDETEVDRKMRQRFFEALNHSSRV